MLIPKILLHPDVFSGNCYWAWSLPPFYPSSPSAPFLWHAQSLPCECFPWQSLFILEPKTILFTPFKFCIVCWSMIWQLFLCQRVTPNALYQDNASVASEWSVPSMFLCLIIGPLSVALLTPPWWAFPRVRYFLLSPLTTAMESIVSHTP